MLNISSQSIMLEFLSPNLEECSCWLIRLDSKTGQLSLMTKSQCHTWVNKNLIQGKIEEFFLTSTRIRKLINYFNNYRGFCSFCIHVSYELASCPFTNTRYQPEVVFHLQLPLMGKSLKPWRNIIRRYQSCHRRINQPDFWTEFVVHLIIPSGMVKINLVGIYTRLKVEGLKDWTIRSQNLQKNKEFECRWSHG